MRSTKENAYLSNPAGDPAGIVLDIIVLSPFLLVLCKHLRQLIARGSDQIEGLSYTGPGLSLRAGGRGFSRATKRVAPGYFYWKIEEE